MAAQMIRFYAKKNEVVSAKGGDLWVERLIDSLFTGRCGVKN